MKKLFIVLFFSVLTAELFPQDLIITEYGDSINCNITAVKKGNVYFLHKSDEGVKGSILPVSVVKAYRYKYFRNVPAPERLSAAKENSGNDDYHHVHFSINGGYGFEFARLSEAIPPDLKNYYNKLRSGFNINGDISFFLAEQIGLGFKYQCFMTSNSMDNASIASSGSILHGRLSDNLKISFYGLMFSMRTEHAGGSAFFSNYYLGYMRYKDNAVFLNSYTLTGGTVGLGLEGGYEVAIGDNIWLGFQASITAGGIRQFKRSDKTGIQTIKLEDDSYESLHRIDFTIGIRFR